MLNGYTFALIAMLFWGIAPIFGKLGLSELQPLLALTLRSTITTLILLAAVFISGQGAALLDVRGHDVLFIALEGICAALLGQLAYYYALKYGSVSQVSPMVSAFPLLAFFLAVIFLGEKFTLWKIVGAVLVIAGVICLRY